MRRTDSADIAALMIRKALLPNLLTSIPAGSIRMVDDRFPVLMTRAFSNSLAPVSFRYNGKRGWTSWLVRPIVIFMANRVMSARFSSFNGISL